MNLIDMSVSAAALIAIVAVVRMLAVHRLPRRTFLILWAIVLCRLLVPMSLPVPWSSFPAFGGFHLATEDAHKKLTTVWLPETAKPAGSGVVAGPSDGGGGEQAVGFHTPAVADASANDPAWLPALSPFVWLWLAGAAAMAVWFVATHVRRRKEYAVSLPVDDGFASRWLAAHPLRRTVRLRMSDRIDSPLTYGIWRPVILLPKSLIGADPVRLEHVLAHERIHIKQFDTLTKWLLAFTLCLHWFNPFVWLMYRLINRDIELACDEKTVRTLGERAKSSYARTLIGMEETRSRLTPLVSHFSKLAIEERVISIMKFKRTTLSGLLLALVLVAGMTAAFAASAMDPKPPAGLFERALGADASRYAGYLNEITDPAAIKKTDRYSLALTGTLFTDRHVHALIAATGTLPAEPTVTGRIVYADHEQTLFALAGESREVESGADGTRYFLFTAEIAEPAPPGQTNAMAALAAGDQFRKLSSLRDYAGERLELAVALPEAAATLATPIANVATHALVFYPEPAGGNGDYYDTVVLTPYEWKFSGHSGQTYDSYEAWNKQLYFKAAILLKDGSRIRMSYDSRGSISDEGYPLGMSRGQSMENGSFYHWWNFREWELDLSRVAGIEINGVVYRADNRPAPSDL
ncbi:MAG: M56 family metallopeptidase [Paenibacillaceae bacterium]|nr:M56 family metallopeptidase [Paenibacillaceae bacterium]